MNYAGRIRKLRRALQKHQLEALWITHLPDVRYLCGFSGSSAVLIVTRRKAALFTDGRYTLQARQEVQGATVHIAAKSTVKEAAAWAAEEAEFAGFDPANTRVAELESYREALPRRQRAKFFRPIPEPLVMNLRLIKDEDEILLMQEAALMGCKLFDLIVPHIRPGMTEIEVAADLEFFARSLGAEGMSFDTIVASGVRSSMPHGRASLAKIPRKGFVTLDFGVILNGYLSDMTRTVHVGRATKEEQFAYDAVLAAQEAGVAAVKPGATMASVDEAARSVLREAGLAEYFTHGTGHGVGLEIHEQPRFAAGQEAKLKPGMVVTIEPGVYLPEKFGIRIEDMVVVTETGAAVLTPATKAWMEL
ncbi:MULTISPECIES: aminopeptidase P family protein [Acidobacterium]|uniref:Peptidase, M24 family n=1 Tax=Acidobacterium capsulatum (strain ATCC 51196 / DSM 11244 / BCRC 80197 / JCM 7670 / NBRC 15755 / NCIMB 13165 / 161) TaxID=240015 RepID=C1F8K2_ACIC5|nr:MULTISPECIES: aminopeptidase P family protein [Acidobacterium]ACO34028.1 peptidase, M24 family [Acidobacterium capsulatum ATCC 51196]HCT61502.1 aminopeptidase P family protein [Acidobacterium sp.]